ncbi:hypothetical protein [Salinibius halmophilus]|uniref:hypothetical protein n=1 Tax=Salinibius halmophilus TaxID=1853216 RepID=UPI000E66D240|nr:hypothetical protein [Salinibius halmophilus]
MSERRATGVAISDNHLTMVRLERPSKGGYRMLAYRHEPTQSFDDVEAILPRLAKAMKASDDVFGLSIANQKYDLQLIDLPDVPVDEMSAALPFKVRDFVNQDVDTLAMDWIPLPEGAWRGRRKMGFVVTTDKSQLANVERRFFKSGFRLQQIQVLQTAVCKASASANQVGTTAILFDWQNRSELIIHQQGNLLLHRFIDVSLDDANQLGDSLAQHSLALEVQRSFDFLESQMALQRPSSLMIMSDDLVIDELLDQLQLDLSVPCDQYSAAHYIEQVPKVHSACAFAIALGAATAVLESGL